MIVLKEGTIMELKDKLLMLRKEKNLSQQQLADQLNVSRQSISKWELGESQPDISNIVLLSEIFHVSTDYLLKDEYEGEVKKDNHLTSIMIVATCIIIGGLLFGHVTWKENQEALWLLLGMLIQLIGIAVFEYFVLKSKSERMQDLFISINIWFISLLPIQYFVEYTKTFSLILSKVNFLFQGSIGGIFYMYFPLIISLSISLIVFLLFRVKKTN